LNLSTVVPAPVCARDPSGPASVCPPSPGSELLLVSLQLGHEAGVGVDDVASCLHFLPERRWRKTAQVRI
jgi:hypothetical protein